MAIQALVDCNNFYVSCERVFAPRLANQPVVVLTNNDGCIIARSPEAKALGFTMGQPEYQARARLKHHGVAVFSSNYALYGDISARVMATLSRFSPRMEVYSIDEAFLDLSGIQEDQEALARRIQATVRQWTGIPVSIGLGPSKTLAKAANKLAKKHPETGGVLSLLTPEQRREHLPRLEVGEVWGIAQAHCKRLKARGVFTAWDFMGLPRDWVKKNLTVAGLHIWLELHAISCLPLELAPKPKKTVISSRSFGRPVTTLLEMQQALTQHASRAAQRLRAQGGLAGNVLVFIQTNTFIAGEPQYCQAQSAALYPRTAYTPAIALRGQEILERIFKPGYRYKKIGVMLSGIEAAASAQVPLFPTEEEKGKRFMAALDAVNAKWGQDTLYCAARGVDLAWRMRQARRSPRYTTVWTELPLVRADLPLDAVHGIKKP